MAGERSFLQQLQDFKDEYIDPTIKYLNPFRKVKIDELEGKRFVDKWWEASDVISGKSKNPLEWFLKGEPAKPGLLDYPVLGIPKVVFWIGSRILCWSAEEDTVAAAIKKQPWHVLWFWIFCVPILLQTILGTVLTIVFAPLVGLVNWLYPYDQDFVNEAAAKKENYKIGTVGRTRRRAFFNPSTWMFIGFVVPLAISFLIQGLAFNKLIGAEILAQAAGPLLMIQTVFTGIAALMLVGAVLGLVHYAYELYTTEELPTSPDYPKSAVVEYFKDFGKWMSDHKAVAIPVMILCVGSVLAALVLIIGYFTGFGVPGVFDFMLPVFNFIGSGFASGVQGLSGLPRLGFLGGLTAGPGLELASQVFTIFALVVATMFTVDTARRLTQTAIEGGGPVVPDTSVGMRGADADGKPGLLFNPVPTAVSIQRAQELSAEAETMAKSSGFTEIMIATKNRDYELVRTADGKNTTAMAEIVQGQRVYLDPMKKAPTYRWGSIGPNAKPGWVANADLQPLLDVSQLAQRNPSSGK